MKTRIAPPGARFKRRPQLTTAERLSVFFYLLASALPWGWLFALAYLGLLSTVCMLVWA